MLAIGFAGASQAAPYAAVVMDARNGKVLHSRNADTRLHPASLTKMMTLYIAFEAVRRGEISLDTRVRISKFAAAEPASKLWLKAGSRVKLRYLIRASAVKSANDAATAIAEAISGSEEAFARRMNRTARALGMKNTNFKNAHGLTQKGHYSSARDMTILGRHMIYDYPQYYNLFSRRTTNANGTEVANTNRRLLNAYKGADGIKTGYTRAAGFNLVASAERGRERIIATMFGGTSGAARNKRVAELLDMGFDRAPSRVALRKPRPPRYSSLPDAVVSGGGVEIASSMRPAPRPGSQIALAPPGTTGTEQIAAASTAGILNAPVDGTAAQTVPQDVIDAQIASALQDAGRAALDPPQPTQVAVTRRRPDMTVPAWPMPVQRPAKVTYSAVSAAPDGSIETASAASATTVPAPIVVPRVSGSGGRQWGINIGTYASRYEAERVLLKTALIEIETLNDALRQVVPGNRGFEASFVGLTERSAALACQRLTARAHDCTPIGP
ncbi:MAG: serine hydrolase [Pseudomonadota bacterium]